MKSEDLAAVLFSMCQEYAEDAEKLGIETNTINNEILFGLAEAIVMVVYLAFSCKEHRKVMLKAVFDSLYEKMDEDD